MSECRQFLTVGGKFIAFGKTGFKLYYSHPFNTSKTYVLYKHIKKIPAYYINGNNYSFDIHCNTLENPDVEEILQITFHQKEVACDASKKLHEKYTSAKDEIIGYD